MIDEYTVEKSPVETFFGAKTVEFKTSTPLYEYLIKKYGKGPHDVKEVHFIGQKKDDEKKVGRPEFVILDIGEGVRMSGFLLKKVS
jgi:hypothetical protein